MALTFLADIPGIITSTLGLGSPTPNYPKVEDQNDIYKDGTPNKNFNKSLGYAFGVFENGKYGTPSAGWKTFYLQINPQQLQQDEEFSIQFFPTPKGITVEHQGSIMKDIVISGVTGIQPRRGVGGVDNDGDLIMSKGESGYKQFHDLRNYIRAYIEKKKDPDNKDLQLVFFNIKDQEFFVVEPTRFSLKRSSDRPLAYEYTITMKALTRATALPDDRNLFERILGTIDDVFDEALNLIKVSRGILNGSVELIRTVDREVRSKILTPLEQVELAIEDFQAGLTTVMNLPRRFLKDLKNQITEIGDKFSDIKGVDTTSYNSFKGRTVVNLPETERELTYEEWRVLNAMKNANIGLELLSFNNEHFSQTNNDTIDDINEIYGIDGLVQKSNSSVSIQIQENDTVQDIAARILGDADRYKELIVLNNLKYPYIAETRGDGVLAYTDTILVPRQTVLDDTIKNIYSNIDYAITNELTQSEKNLGVDIALTNNKDLAVTNTNDYDLIAGVSVVLQTIGIRLGTNKGAYRLHTQFGVGLGIGEKNILAATLIKNEVEQQLLADTRIQPGSTVLVNINGNTINVTVNARIKNIGQTLPLQLVSQI